jgi:hypothetical protein
MSYLLTTDTNRSPDLSLWNDPDDRLAVPKPYLLSMYGEDLWWQRTGFAGVNMDAGIDTVKVGEFERDVRWSGTKSRKVISGITRDSASAPLVGVTVQAFRTSADDANGYAANAQEGPTVISAPDGAYAVPVPNTDQHYLVAYKAGSPDLVGTTVNTLVGT